MLTLLFILYKSDGGRNPQTIHSTSLYIGAKYLNREKKNCQHIHYQATTSMSASSVSSL